MKDIDKLKGIYITLTTINLIEINDVVDEYLKYLSISPLTYRYYILNSFNWDISDSINLWQALSRQEAQSHLKQVNNKHKLAITYLKN